jgi:hypothetical protein
VDEDDLHRLEAMGSELTYGRVLAVPRADIDRLCAEDAAFAERLAQL